MRLPIVAIVGRPNVGKSSLLNALAGRRISIVDPTAGVTRDRVSALCDQDGVWFEAIDTGGYGIEDRDNLTEDVERQIGFAIASADLILFMVDAKEAITPLDRDVARLLKGRQAQVMLLANKSDSDALEGQTGEFLKLGFGDPRALSVVHGRGMRELREAIAARFKDATDRPPDPVMKITLVGRRNVGKSTFVNALAGEPRMIVSEIPGTTRDSVDVRFEKDGQTFVVIDTAGVRKVRKMADDIEYYAYHRAQRAVRRADVVLMLIDAEEAVGEVDKKLVSYIVEQCKPVVLVVNKWDLAKDRADTDSYGEYLTRAITGLTYAPVAFTTASERRNVAAVVDLAKALYKQAATRVDTGPLNQALAEVLAERSPPSGPGGRPAKIYFATQIGVLPPTIVLFCNNAALVREDYRRFVEKQLGARLPFLEVPVRLIWRRRESNTRAAAAQRAEGGG